MSDDARRVVFVDERPRNTMGKVNKNVPREKFSELYALPARAS
jgi:malonyl-CoA/methylmalonyl-CoA synthetase